eukprot:7013003-Pyramimonas_sp.AAC.1
MGISPRSPRWVIGTAPDEPEVGRRAGRRAPAPSRIHATPASRAGILQRRPRVTHFGVVVVVVVVVGLR